MEQHRFHPIFLFYGPLGLWALYVGIRRGLIERRLMYRGRMLTGKWAIAMGLLTALVGLLVMSWCVFAYYGFPRR